MARIFALRSVLRLAWRDMCRHRARTTFSTLLIALPMMALIVGATLMTGAPPMRERAVRSIPEGAQAVITATAVKRDGNPFEQPPEGASIWMDEITQQPASEDELKRIVPSSDKLLPYWDSEQLIAATATGLQPGQVESAKNSSIGGTLAQSGTGTARLCEAGAEALGMLLPKLSEGTVPSNADEIVVTSGLASRIGADIGDTITLIAPPFQGSYSTNGRIAAVIQNSQRAWRISGIVADDAISKAWARDGWMSGMVAHDGGAGVDRHYLVVGDKPITWRQVKKMNLLQTVAVSRHVLTDGYPNASERYPSRIDSQALLQYAVGFIVAVAMGVALVLCLVTPAFSISVDQSRRTMGLASACGAGPRDVRNMFGLQGVCSGFAGGVIGMLAGIGGIYVMAPSVIHVDVHEIPQVIPWGLFPLVVMTSTLIGAFATWMPARRAGRMNVVDALRDRPDGLERERYAGKGAGKIALISGPMLMLAACGCAVTSMRGKVSDVSSPGVLPEGSGTSLVLLVAAIVLAMIGLVRLVKGLIVIYGAVGRSLPLSMRTGLRDSAEHHRRFVPATIAVVLTMALASYAMVLIGSTLANDRSMELVHGQSHVILSAEVPVNDDTDRMVVADGIRKLGDTASFKDHQPIYALAQPDAESTMNLTGKAYDDIYAQYPTVKALLATELHCEVNERQQYGQDMASAFDPNGTPYCVNWSKSYEAVGYTGLSMINMDPSVIIMSADAMRMTGFPNAEQAARTLEEGGVVVGNAAALREDGTVTLQVSHRTLDDDGNSGSEHVVRQSVRKATWMKGFYPLAMSERTARELGIVNLRYVGDIAALDHVHGWSAIERLRKATSDMPLVNMTSQRYQYEWATDADGAKITLAPIVALGLLALTATVVSLLLSRTQTIRDMTTMHAVGASPGFLRRLGLVQAMTILLPGVPLGMIAGLALGCYHIAWYRRIGIDGAWLETVPCWQLQIALAITVIAAGSLSAWLVTSPPRNLTRRTID